MNDFYEKYLKYKKKYLKLKRITGGRGGTPRIREFITWNVAHECMFGPRHNCRACRNVGPGNNTICQNNLIGVFNKLEHRPHFVAIQEGNQNLSSRIISKLNSKYSGHVWNSLIYNSTRVVTAILIYDSTRLKPLNTFAGNCDGKSGRPFVGALFEERSITNSDGSKPKLTVVSIHGPHGHGSERYTHRSSPKAILQQIVNSFATALGRSSNDTNNRNLFFENPCFIMGDFNQEFNSLYLHSPFNNLIHVNNNINTCCSMPKSNWPDTRNLKYDNIVFRQHRGGGPGKTVVLKEFGTFKNVSKSSGSSYTSYNLPENSQGRFRYSRWTSDHLPLAARFEIS